MYAGSSSLSNSRDTLRACVMSAKAGSDWLSETSVCSNQLFSTNHAGVPVSGFPWLAWKYASFHSAAIAGSLLPLEKFKYPANRLSESSSDSGGGVLDMGVWQRTVGVDAENFGTEESILNFCYASYRFAVFLFAVFFLAAFFLVAFFTAAFLVLLVDTFFAAVFLVAAFFVAFFLVAFFAVTFFAAAFFVAFFLVAFFLVVFFLLVVFFAPLKISFQLLEYFSLVPMRRMVMFEFG